MKSVIGILVFTSLNSFGAAMSASPAFHLPSQQDPTLEQSLATAECPHLKAKRLQAMLAANHVMNTSTESSYKKGQK